MKPNLKNRTPTERRRRLTGRLRKCASRQYGIMESGISDSDFLGPKYRAIIDDVVRQEGRPPLKHYGQLDELTPLWKAVEFLMTVVQS